MDDDELTHFRSYLSQQVDDLQRKVDAWLLMRASAAALGDRQDRGGLAVESGACPAEPEKPWTSAASGRSPRPSFDGSDGEDGGGGIRRRHASPTTDDDAASTVPGGCEDCSDGFAKPKPTLAVRASSEKQPRQPAAAGTQERRRPLAERHVAAAMRAHRTSAGGLEVTVSGKESDRQQSEASHREIVASGGVKPSRRSLSRPARVSLRSSEARGSSYFGGIGSLRLSRGVCGGTSIGAVLSSAASRQMLNASTASIRLGLVAVLRYFFFDWFFAIVTILNVAAIGLSAEVHPGWYGWIVIDTIFAVLFTIEIMVRMREVGLRQYFLGEDLSCAWRRNPELRWRLFEFALIILAYVDLGLSLLQRASPDEFTILRTLRLTRIARVLRVCRLQVFAELVMMINGAIGGVRTLICSFALIATPLYAMALVMRDSLGSQKGSGAETFSSLPLAWFTMFRCTIAGDCTTAEGRPVFLLVSQKYGWAYGLLFCLTTIIMSFGMYNTIAAIFVENTLAAAKCNTVLQKRQRLLDRKVFSEKAAELIQFMWGVNKLREEHGAAIDNMERKELVASLQPMTEADLHEATTLRITPDFFEYLLAFREFKVLLEELDVSEEDQVDMFDTLDVDGDGGIDLEEMIVGISKLRGEARRADIIGVSLVVRSIQAEVKQLKEVLYHTHPRGTRAAGRTVAMPRGDDSPAAGVAGRIGDPLWNGDTVAV